MTYFLTIILTVIASVYNSIVSWGASSYTEPIYAVISKLLLIIPMYCFKFSLHKLWKLFRTDDRERWYVCLWIDCWNVIIISGSYSGEPQDVFSDQHAQAVAADGDDRPHASDKPDAEDNVGREKDVSSEQQVETKAKQDELKQQTHAEDNIAAENTNNNAKSDSEDNDHFTKKRNKSSKYFVSPRPPTSRLLLVVYGDLGKTGMLPLTADNLQEASFQAGQADEFQVGHLHFHGLVIIISDMILTGHELRFDFFTLLTTLIGRLEASSLDMDHP